MTNSAALSRREAASATTTIGRLHSGDVVVLEVRVCSKWQAQSPNKARLLRACAREQWQQGEANIEMRK